VRLVRERAFAQFAYLAPICSALAVAFLPAAFAAVLVHKPRPAEHCTVGLFVGSNNLAALPQAYHNDTNDDTDNDSWKAPFAWLVDNKFDELLCVIEQ
jgi:hypothetical protein